jgi:hypothetical protein
MSKQSSNEVPIRPRLSPNSVPIRSQAGVDLFTAMQGLAPLLTFKKKKKKKIVYIFMSNCSPAMFLPLHFKIICPSILKLFLTFPPLISPLPYFLKILPNPLADNHPIPNISIFLFFFLFLLFNLHPPKPPLSPHFFSPLLVGIC